MLPPGENNLTLCLKKDTAPVHEIFKLVQKWGNIDEMEMYGTFNMGIGMVLCVSEEDADNIISAIGQNTNGDNGYKAYKIGAALNHMDKEGDSNIVII